MKWRVEGEFDDDVAIEIRDEDDCFICEIVPFEDGWEPREKALAYLIAAAPELLEALKDVLHEIEKLKLIGIATRNASLAIDKAEGRNA